MTMSTRLTKALEFANYRTTLNNQQSQLKAKIQSQLSYSINGGSFTINRELITFVKLLIDDGEKEARSWTIVKQDGDAYTAHSDDVVGIGVGHVKGVVFKLRYDLLNNDNKLNLLI